MYHHFDILSNGCRWSRSINLLIRNQSWSWVIPLVKISASWRPKDTCGRVYTPISTCSLMKWQFVLHLYYEHEVEWQMKWKCLIFVTVHKERISHHAEDVTWCSDLLEDLETWSCLLHFHEIKARPRYNRVLRRDNKIFFNKFWSFHCGGHSF